MELETLICSNCNKSYDALVNYIADNDLTIDPDIIVTRACDKCYIYYNLIQYGADDYCICKQYADFECLFINCCDCLNVLIKLKPYIKEYGYGSPIINNIFTHNIEHICNSKFDLDRFLKIFGYNIGDCDIEYLLQNRFATTKNANII